MQSLLVALSRVQYLYVILYLVILSIVMMMILMSSYLLSWWCTRNRMYISMSSVFIRYSLSCYIHCLRSFFFPLQSSFDFNDDAEEEHDWKSCSISIFCGAINTKRVCLSFKIQTTFLFKSFLLNNNKARTSFWTWNDHLSMRTQSFYVI